MAHTKFLTFFGAGLALAGVAFAAPSATPTAGAGGASSTTTTPPGDPYTMPPGDTSKPYTGDKPGVEAPRPGIPPQTDVKPKKKKKKKARAKKRRAANSGR
jgi:hypothetical protein